MSELAAAYEVHPTMIHQWKKALLEGAAGRTRNCMSRLGDTARQANTGEVKDLRAEALALKELVADLTLKNRLLKKT